MTINEINNIFLNNSDDQILKTEWYRLITNSDSKLREVINIAIKRQDQDLLWFLLDYTNFIFQKDLVHIALLSRWHTIHEQIIEALQSCIEESDIHIIIEVIEKKIWGENYINKPDYITDQTTVELFGIAKKSIYTLAALKSDKARQALQYLQNNMNKYGFNEEYNEPEILLSIINECLNSMNTK